jgi:hypothetical protein
MLKKLAMLTVLTVATVGVLPAQDAPPNAPKQGVSEADSGHGGGNQPQPQHSEQTTPSAVTPAQQPTTPTCDESCQQGRENVAIQRKLVWFTLGLVVVGFLQVTTMIWQAYLLRQTRDDVHSQAKTMADQARDAREAAASSALDTKATLEALIRQANSLDKQALNTANQIDLIIEKEKGRLSLTDVELSMEDGFPVVRYWVANHGTTPAFITASWYICEVLPISDLEWPQEQLGSVLRDLPEVISSDRLLGKAFVWHIGAYKTWDETENSIKNGENWLFFRVRITYRHIFDDINTETLTVSKVYGLDRSRGGMFAEWRDSRYAYGETDNPN